MVKLVPFEFVEPHNLQSTVFRLHTQTTSLQQKLWGTSSSSCVGWSDNFPVRNNHVLSLSPSFIFVLPSCRFPPCMYANWKSTMSHPCWWKMLWRVWFSTQQQNCWSIIWSDRCFFCFCFFIVTVFFVVSQSFFSTVLHTWVQTASR